MTDNAITSPYQMAGVWLHSSRHEIRGDVIVPTAGAEILESHPLVEFENDPVAPYLRLFWLLRDLRSSGVHTDIALSEADERRLLGWVDAHGLLGVLHQRLLLAYFAPRWEQYQVEGDVRFDSSGNEDIPLIPVQFRLYRTSDGWATDARLYVPPRGRVGPATELGTRVPDSYVPDYMWPNPSAVLQPVGDVGAILEPLSLTWARHFPGVAAEELDIYPYPLPTERRFYELYAEPVSAFLEAARTLRSALASLAIRPEPRSPREDVLVEEGRRKMNALVRDAATTIVRLPTGGFGKEFVGHSLLSLYALMIVEDLTKPNSRAAVCPVCPTPFVARRPDALYCSDRCRQTAQKRTLRQRKREKMS